MIPIVAGVATAAVLAVAANLTRFDRDKSFYPTLVIVIASYYLLFAVMDGSPKTIAIELMVVSTFALAAVYSGLRLPALAGWAILVHGIFDVAHGHVIDNAGVPVWWPAYCAAVDVPLGAWVIYLAGRETPETAS